MNERIKELTEQADKWAGTEFHRLFLENINANRQELFNKKFAELIVKECVRVGGQAFLHDNSTVPTFPSNQILEHFGVE